MAPATSTWDVDDLKREWVNNWGGPTPWEWDFGDGSVFVDRGTSMIGPLTVNKTFWSLGTYPVKLKVTDNEGNVGVITRNVVVENSPPEPQIAARCVGLDCSFGSNSSWDDGGIQSCEWDFGDGQTASGRTATHSYPYGCYTVKLSCTDVDGASGSVLRTVALSKNPVLVPTNVTVDVKSTTYGYPDPGLSADVPTRSNLNGIAEPGETVVVEPTWAATPQTAPYSAATPAVTVTGAGLTAKFLRPQTVFDLNTGTANCWNAATNSGADLTNGCNVLHIAASGTRSPRHADVRWTERRPDGTTVPMSVHVGNTFDDVTPNIWWYGFVESVTHAGLTTGCTTTSFCPSDTFNRDQAAVWLLRIVHGASYIPPKCTTDPFADVSCSTHWAADWIAQLKAEGITAANAANYDPSRAVTRAEMSVFLLRVRNGVNYLPPKCTQDYSDVACSGVSSTSHWAADWISALKKVFPFECAAGKYCPDSAVIRADAAIYFGITYKLSVDGHICALDKPVYASAVEETPSAGDSK